LRGGYLGRGYLRGSHLRGSYLRGGHLGRGHLGRGYLGGGYWGRGYLGGGYWGRGYLGGGYWGRVSQAGRARRVGLAVPVAVYRAVAGVSGTGGAEGRNRVKDLSLALRPNTTVVHYAHPTETR